MSANSTHYRVNWTTNANPAHDRKAVFLALPRLDFRRQNQKYETALPDVTN